MCPVSSVTPLSGMDPGCLERGTGFEPATTSLEGWCSATELPPHSRTLSHPRAVPLLSLRSTAAPDRTRGGPSRVGGLGGIRTPEGVSQQIYSLPPLAAWVPARLEGNRSPRASADRVEGLARGDPGASTY